MKLSNQRKAAPEYRAAFFCSIFEMKEVLFANCHMCRILKLLFIFCALQNELIAQILPKENAMLHYRIIGFSYPVMKEDSDCTVEVAMGNCSNDEEFRKNVIITRDCEKGKAIIEVPAFGKEYTWRVVFFSKTKTHKASIRHHFSCIIASSVDTNVTRLKILKKAEKYKDAYTFMDGSKALYDMDGNPVWYLPERLSTPKSKVWDMKLTPQSTITFLLDQNIYEINYDGDVLWKGPNNGKVSGDSIEYYHHELMKLSNGHYMVLGTEFIPWAAGNAQKTSDTNRKKEAFGTLIEYDHDGNIVWSWKSSKYFKGIDPKYLTTDLYDIKGAGKIVDVHENAFYFDEHEQAAYISFKDISSIIKVKYPEGEVINVYGKLAKHVQNEAGNDWFCGQHSCKTTDEGNLYLYNNNACHKNALPQILMFEQPKLKGDTLKKIWEYTCSFEDVLAEKQLEKEKSGSKDDIPSPEIISSMGIYSKGGNLLILPDHSIFASICGIYGKVFIITPGNEIVWSALLQTFNPYNRKWEDIINYKSNIILNTSELEKLIRKAE